MPSAWVSVDMIFRRLALFLALLVGLGATQVPEFVEQYRQRLGGAIDELATIISGFDSRSARQGLSQADGIARLLADADPLARQEGEEKQEIVARLHALREQQTAFRDAGPVARLVEFATRCDARVARGTWTDFQPAVPTSPEAVVLGLIGFLIGGGAVHVAGRPFRRRHGRNLRDAEPVV
jgi:hypothetical protein